jgi:hypothetical protein
MPGRRAIFAAILSLLVADCASTFHGQGVEGLEDSQVAVLDTDAALACLSECVIVLTVDGKSRGIGSFAKYQLVPGYHEIGMQYAFANGKGIGRNLDSQILILGFNGEAGHSYRISPNPDLVAMRWYPKIIDVQSGAVVSKIVGSQHVIDGPNSRS